MIPFYMSRNQFIQEELTKMSRNPVTPREELEFLQKNADETSRLLNQEVREVKDMADLVVNKWNQIKELRNKNQFSSSNVKLKVFENKQNHEFYFNLLYEEPSSKMFNGTNLPTSEVSRRLNAKKIRAYMRLIINVRYNLLILLIGEVCVKV